MTVQSVQVKEEGGYDEVGPPSEKKLCMKITRMKMLKILRRTLANNLQNMYEDLNKI